MLNYSIEAGRLCLTIYINRRYSNQSRDIELDSAESSSTSTRLDWSQYSDN